MRILVCESDPTTAQIVKRELERSGHEVVVATIEREALRLVRTEWYQFVVLDVTVFGLAPLKALRAAPWTQDVPCVVLTAHPDERAILEAYGAGADMVLTIRPRD